MPSHRHVLAATILFLSTAGGVAAADPQADLAFNVGDHNHDQTSVWITERMFTFKLGKACWDKVLENDGKKYTATALIAAHTRTIAKYAAKVTGDDWLQIEGQSANDPETNRALVDTMIKALAPKLHITVVVEGDDCAATGSAMWLKYLGSVVSAVNDYPPKSGIAKVTLKVVAKAKAVKPEITKDGKTFTITAPRDVEVSGWSAHIEKAFRRVAKPD